MPLPCWRPNLDSLHGYAPRADAVRAACPRSHLLPSFLTSVFARAHLRRAISDVYSYLKDILMRPRPRAVVLPLLLGVAMAQTPTSVELFRNPSLPLEQRVDDLVSKLTLDEKIAMGGQVQPAVPRLGIKAFTNFTEGLHGLGWVWGGSVTATTFPQSVGLGETWDPEILRQVGSVEGYEAHVEHPVGLVEDQDADLGQRDVAALDQIGQPSRRGHEDVRAAGQARLLDDAGAAVHGRDRQRPGVGDRAQLVDDLDRELPGGREDQRRGARVGVFQELHERHAEGERLARAGGRLREHVVAREHVRDDHVLNCEGLGDPALGDLAHDDLGHAEIGERFMLHVVMLLLAALWPPLRMEIRLTPSALQSANKDKEPHGRLRRP